MNNIKTIFSIKDLENLSGIKAHTIRIWEKRYDLLAPERTDTNIRFYSLSSLQKLLNITLLYNNGHKISKIAGYNNEEVVEHARNLVSDQALKNQFINEMKLAMLNFDQQLFEKSYQRILNVISFKEIFTHYFIPFLNELGLLWQTDSINPAHEHFITNLIKQKVLIHVEKLSIQESKQKGHKFILFLPDNEIHDLGLCYLNFEILSKGYSTVFLGPSVPLSSLKAFTGAFEKITFVSYFTIMPEKDKVNDYVAELNNEIIQKCDAELWLLGKNTVHITPTNLSDQIKVFTSIQEAAKNLK